MKKYLLLLIPLSLIIGIWFLLKWKPIEEKNVETTSTEEVSKPIIEGENNISTPKKTPVPQLGQLKDKPSKVFTDKELEEMDKYFEKVEKDWEEGIENLFIKELRLSKETIAEYQKIRGVSIAREIDAIKANKSSMVDGFISIATCLIPEEVSN